MLRGYDLVTLVLIVPALVLSQLSTSRGSDRAQLIWVGMLAYLSCNYAYYLFGVPFSDLFLLHAAVFSSSLLALGGIWVYASIRFITTGELPAGSALVESNAVVQLGLALDLTVLVPAYALAAVLLWRRAATGYVLATVLLIAGTLHQVSYMVALLFQSTAAVPGAVAFDPFEPVIAALYLAATVAMMVTASPRHQPNAAGRSANAQRHTAQTALP
jgi:hypothetical protein